MAPVAKPLGRGFERSCATNPCVFHVAKCDKSEVKLIEEVDADDLIVAWEPG